MIEFNPAVIAEAKIICKSDCRAVTCERFGVCRDMWPGPGGMLPIYFEQALRNVADGPHAFRDGANFLANRKYPKHERALRSCDAAPISDRERLPSRCR